MSPSRLKLLDVVPLVINGISRTGGKQFKVLGPDQNSLLHFMSTIEKHQIDDVCKISNDGFKIWSKMQKSERKSVFHNASRYLLENRNVIVEAQNLIGLPNAFADLNVTLASQMIDDYALQLDMPQGSLLNSVQTDIAVGKYQPIGPVLSMSPWNAPVILATRSIAAPLVAGCSVVFKSSEKSPLLAYFVVKAFLEAGVPKEALQLLHVMPEESKDLVETLLADKNIRMVTYTGSTEVGRQISQAAAKNLKPVLLELGGKNAAIVDNDADIPKAASKLLWSSWLNQGQICMCTDKIFIHEEVYDEFLNAAIDYAKNIEFSGHLRTALATDKATQLVQDALNKGAILEYGSLPESQSKQNTFFTPIILSNISKDMDVDHTELFAPVVSLHKFSDVAQAVELVNDSNYGLKASIWSSDIVRAYKLAEQIECGGIHINNTTVHDEPGVPHGGVKESGVGRFNNTWGMREFQFMKAITINN